MLDKLKKEVYDANMYIYNQGLITLTWGNASGIDREKGLVVIKPSGVSYDLLKPEDMVVVALSTGEIVEGKLNPSSDTKTHIELYKHFPQLGGIVHTHSTFATVIAQQGMDLEPYGTTHADTFYGAIPCTRKLSEEEVKDDYELNTAKVIIEAFKTSDYSSIPGVFVKQHGPFAFGPTPLKAAQNALVLEEVSKIGYFTRNGRGSDTRIDQYLLDKHYQRKHGANAYYGQKGDEEK